MNQVVRWSAGVLAGIPKIFRLNWIIVIAVCFTACIGFVLLYSVANGSYEPWASKQMVRFGTSFALMVVVALIPIWFWRGLAFPIYLVHPRAPRARRVQRRNRHGSDALDQPWRSAVSAVRAHEGQHDPHSCIVL